MWNSIKKVLPFLVWLFLPFTFLEAQRSAPTLLFAADEWAPFNMTPEGEEEGYIIDILRRVYEPLGYRVDYRLVPWKRTIEGTQEGVYHGAVGASKSDGIRRLRASGELKVLLQRYGLEDWK